MPTCVAINCKNRQFKGCGQTFHLFPYSRPALMQEWVDNTRRVKWKPSRKSVLCSDHFSASCFMKPLRLSDDGRTRLKLDAVPTIFNFSRPAVRKTRKKKPPAPKLHVKPPTDNHQSRKNTTQPASPPTASPDSIPHIKTTRGKKPPKMHVKPPTDNHQSEKPLTQSASLPTASPTSIQHIEVEHAYQITASPQTLKCQLDVSHEENNKLRKKLRYSRTETNQLRRKVSTLRKLVENARRRKLISEKVASVFNRACTDAPAGVVRKRLRNWKK